jgi:2-phospho-L-lactate guanylyltransferase (CobY/MobA/RfbA family)
MTVIAVVADPPREGLVLPELVETSPLTEREAADLYAAMLMDVMLAARRSGGDLLVNYRPDELVPEEYVGDESAEAELRTLAETALDDASGVRFEKQVGSSFDARAGNTITHLLREEEAQSAAVVRGNAPFLSRTAIDSAAMKLRSSEVVLGPTTAGRTYFAGFTDPIDFAGAFEPPELRTITNRALAEEHGVDFLSMQPVVERGDDLATALTILDVRRDAGRIVPQYTAGMLDSLNLDIAVEDGRPTVASDTP